MVRGWWEGWRGRRARVRGEGGSRGGGMVGGELFDRLRGVVEAIQREVFWRDLR